MLAAEKDRGFDRRHFAEALARAAGRPDNDFLDLDLDLDLDADKLDEQLRDRGRRMAPRAPVRPHGCPLRLRPERRAGPLDRAGRTRARSSRYAGAGLARPPGRPYPPACDGRER